MGWCLHPIWGVLKKKFSLRELTPQPLSYTPHFPNPRNIPDAELYCCLLCTLTVRNFSLLHPKSSIGDSPIELLGCKQWEIENINLRESAKICSELRNFSAKKKLLFNKIFMGQAPRPPTGEGHSPSPDPSPFAVLTTPPPLFSRLRRHCHGYHKLRVGNRTRLSINTNLYFHHKMVARKEKRNELNCWLIWMILSDLQPWFQGHDIQITGKWQACQIVTMADQ